MCASDRFQRFENQPRGTCSTYLGLFHLGILDLFGFVVDGGCDLFGRFGSYFGGDGGGDGFDDGGFGLISRYQTRTEGRGRAVGRPTWTLTGSAATGAASTESTLDC